MEHPKYAFQVENQERKILRIHPKNIQVPALPWIPLFNVWVNIYLMTALEVSIWIKLTVWLGIGYAIYFFYGIRNSRENVTRVPQDRNDEEEMVLTGDQNF